MNKLILRPENRDQFLQFVQRLDLTKPLQFEWKQHKSKRSAEQNNLYWDWMTFMASRFSVKGNTFTKDDMHDLMRHKHLGYTEKTVGKTLIHPQLKSTTSLDVGEMHHYLTQVDMWAASCGCLLPRPEDSVYDQMCRSEAA